MYPEDVHAVAYHLLGDSSPGADVTGGGQPPLVGVVQRSDCIGQAILW